MKKVGKMWILDNDKFFGERFEKTGDKFDHEHLYGALECVDQFRIAIDIGAHYGTWTRTLSERFRNVIAIEGKPDLVKCLEKNTEGYKNVDIRPIAVGDRFDSVNIAISPRWPGKKGNSGIATVVGKGSIPMVPLDSLKLMYVDFLKIDVEGYELFVLKGAVKTIKTNHPVIIFEENRRCLEHGVKQGECGAFLESLGYEFKKVYPGKDYVYVWKQ